MDQRRVAGLQVDARAERQGARAQDDRLHVPAQPARGASVGRVVASGESGLAAERLGAQLGLVSPERQRRDRGDERRVRRRRLCLGAERQEGHHQRLPGALRRFAAQSARDGRERQVGAALRNGRARPLPHHLQAEQGRLRRGQVVRLAQEEGAAHVHARPDGQVERCAIHTILDNGCKHRIN